MQKIFLTGASSGIGAAFAVHYAKTGAILGLAARRETELKTLAESLKKAGAKEVHIYPLDVTDVKALKAAADDFMRREGAPNIVITCAGVSSGTLTECAEDLPALKRIFEINVFGMAATFSPFIGAMKEAAKRGESVRLAGIASVAGIRGLPGSEAYSASKAATITYLESLRVEMRPYGIKVVTLVPGYIKTPMTAVNQYKMPFLTEASVAAARFSQAIKDGDSYKVVPWQMGLVAKAMRLLPNFLFDALFANAPHKKKVLKLPENHL